MDNLTEKLLQLKFPENTTRKNVMRDGDKSYKAFVLGEVWSWAHKEVKETGRCLRVSNTTRQPKYQQIYELSKDLGHAYGCEFTTIQYNKNYQCKKHIDGHNMGVSHIIGLGNYTGGELLVYYDGPDKPPLAVDINNKFYTFNGSEYYHETSEFEGDRISLVYFSL
tara:strand:+ start:1129 stop:1626 length:498 start_codon:yes stop_codon:yes gene_type:complete